MIEHNGKVFDDNKLRPYEFTKRLVKNYYADECEVFIVYGMPEGIGKSALVNHVLADVYGFQKCKDKELLKWMWDKKPQADTPLWEADWEKPKKYIRYLPVDVVNLCIRMIEKQSRDVAFHWDDAGTWLNAMEYHDPFVIAFLEYLSLARSNWGGIVLSTPVEEWILKKLHTARGFLHIEVKRKPATDWRYIWRPRVATCYKMQKYKGVRRTYWPRQWQDFFIAIMPDDFFKWYKPRRDKYTLMATLKMRAALERRRKRGWDVYEDEAIVEERLQHLRKEIWRANDKSGDFLEAIRSAE